MSTEKLSGWVLKGLLALTVVVFALFFLVGFSTPWEEDPKMNNPKLTDVVLWLCIILVIVTAVLTVWSVIKQITTGGNTTSKDTGWAARTGLIAFGTMAASIVIGLIVGIANKNEHLLINGKDWTNPLDMIITDTSIVSIAILMVVTILALIFSMVVRVKK